MESLILLDPRGHRFLVPSSGELETVHGLGVVDTSKLQASVGHRVSVGGQTFMVLPPTLRDHLLTLRRRAQIVLPKDSFRLALECDLKAGATVVEGGSGSAALTLVLAHCIKPGGRVISYEAREDFARVARENVRRAGASDVVEVMVRDITEGIEEVGVDAVALDIPEPWKALRGVHGALKPGGAFASYSPTVEQVRETVQGLRRLPFVEIRALETLERGWEVGERGSRPAFEMLGHSGYLTFATKVEEMP